jgi:hypothetical protein
MATATTTAEKVKFAEQIMEIISDHQNVGWNRDAIPFVDVEEAFTKIITAANAVMEINPSNGLLIPKE